MNKREELKAMIESVDRLADAMKKKLRQKAAQGYHGGLSPSYRHEVGRKLQEHVTRMTGYCPHCHSHDAEHDPEEGAEQAVDVCNLVLMVWWSEAEKARRADRGSANG